MAQTVTQTNTTTNLMDPALRNAILGNVDLARLILSGVLPQGANAPWAPGAATGGASGGVSSNLGGYWDPNTGDFIDNSTGAPVDFGGGSGGGPYTVGGQQYVPPSTLTAGLTPDQIEAIRRSRGISGINYDPENFGGAAIRDIIGMQTPTSQAASYDPTKFTDLDFQKYLMPGREQVIDPLKNYLSEMADRSVASNLSTGLAGSAVRGSNNSLREAQIRGEIALQSTPVISDALQRMYGLSAGLAQGDLSAMNAASATNAGFRQQTGLANQQAALTMPQIRLAGINTGMDAVTRARDLNVSNADLLNRSGELQRMIEQAKIDDPLKALDILNRLTSGAASATGGTSSTGTQTVPQSSGGLAGALGGAAAGAGLAGALSLSNPWTAGLAGIGALIGLF